MIDENPDTIKGGAASWFLRKLFTTPATYLGLAAAIGVGRASLGVDMPVGGAIASGIMTGIFVAFVSFGVMHGIRTAHRAAIAKGDDNENGTSAKEKAIVETLRGSLQSDDADLLEKLFADRDAIRRRCNERADAPDAIHTLELASAIVAEACHQAGELHDLVRRVEDPLLDSSDDAEEKIATIRGDLRQAYQAVADARSRLRRGESLKETDFLADAESMRNRNLASLASQLEEETTISRRIEERLRPKFENRIVMEDPVESDGGDLHESE